MTDPTRETKGTAVSARAGRPSDATHPEHTDRKDACLVGCREAVSRLEQILDRLSPRAYVASSEGHASIGAHLRHAVEHFTCFFAGIESGLVDYDARSRDPVLESDLRLARQSLQAIQERLSSIGESDLEGLTRVRQLAAPGRDATTVESSRRRELLMLSGHTIHHIAIIELLAGRLGVDLPRELGLAFSTEAHRSGNP